MNSRWTPSLPRPGPLLGALVGAAALNCFPLEVIGDAQVLLGPFLYLPFVLLLPVPWAVTAAGLALAPTLWTLGQPFALVLGMVEAGVLAWSLQRSRLPSPAVALIYWLFFGWPVSLWMSVSLARVPVDLAVLDALVRGTTQILAVVVAEFLVRYTAVGGLLSEQSAPPARLRDVVFNYVFVLAAVPVALLATGLAVLLRTTVEREDRTVLFERARQVAREAGQVLRLHEAAVATAAGVLSRPSSDPESVLGAMQVGFPGFAAMLVLDNDGRVLSAHAASARRRLQDANVPMLEALRAASGLRRLGVSGPVWERGLSDDILLLVSAPLVRADGTRSGTVVGALRVAPLVSVVSRMSDPGDVQWVLANAAGQVLYASPDTGLTPMGNLPESHLGRILLNRPEEPLLHDGTVAGSGRRLRAYVARDDDYRLLVIAQRPALAAAGSSVGIYAMMAGIMAGVILTAALVARLAVVRLSQPLEQFAEAAGKQARAGLAERMPVPTERVAGEIREIYATFNRLADRLNETYAALLRNNQSLEQRVSERTGELERVRREAVEASDSKTAFLALAGREFRTPLEAIMAEAEWLRGQIRDPGLALQLDLIRDGGRMLLAVVEDLQELSRLEAGRLEIRRGPLELRALCERVVADASGEALARGLGLSLESTLVRDLWVETDGARLERALRVLLRDAIQATDAGNVWLCVDATGSDPVELRFRVVDSGPGVSDSQRAALLRPAFPAEPGSPVDRSAGLGLTLGRRLIELLGGRIDIHGGEVRGLELDFALKVKAVPAPLPAIPAPAREVTESFKEAKPPLLIRNALTTPEPARLPAVEAVAGVALANCELLVVDDTPANLEVMRALLEGRCRRLVTVASAREALALLKSERFTAALIDLEMPEMDGFALLDEIRQWQQGEASRGCRLIAVSAHPAEQMRTDCWARGFDEYVEKPVSRKSLVAALSGFGRSGS